MEPGSVREIPYLVLSKDSPSTINNKTRPPWKASFLGVVNMNSSAGREHSNHPEPGSSDAGWGRFGACGDNTESRPIPRRRYPVVVQTAAGTPLTTEMVETAGYREIEVRARVGGILLKRTYVKASWSPPVRSCS